MKHYFKSYTLALFSIIFLMLFASCEEENFIPEQAAEAETEATVVAKENPLKVREVSQADIPNVLSKIKGKMSSAAKFYGNKIVQDDIEIYLDQVKEAVKKGEHSNFSFPVHVDGSPLTHLYIMTVDREIDGSVGEPYIVKYELSQESYDYFMEENNGIIDFRYFKADYTYYTLDEFLNNKANKTPGCQGSLGAGPGYYPTMNPGESLTNTLPNGTASATTHFSTSIFDTHIYVYTQTLTPAEADGSESSSVSTLTASTYVTSTTPINTNSQNIVGTGIPANTAFVHQDINAEQDNESGNSGGSSGGAGCTTTYTQGLDGGGSWQINCPQPNNGDNNTHSYRGNKATPTMCTPVDYSTINTLDMLSAQMSFTFGLQGGWLQGHREFTQPLKDYWDDCGQTDADEFFGQVIIAAVIEEEITEVEALQILFKENNSEQGIIFANCLSWEFANQSNGVKAAAVTGINNLFVGIRDVNGQRSVISIPAVFGTLYFTAPSHWTNGRAATVTALAYDVATKETEAWFATHINASDQALKDKWRTNLVLAISSFGGTVSGTNHHGVFRPAPFVRSFTPTNCG